MIEANNPSLKSWIDVPENSDFPIQNLPFGIFNTKDNVQKRVGIAIGDKVIDLSVLYKNDLFNTIDIKDENIFLNDFLNDFMALGRTVWRAVRQRVSELLRVDNNEIQQNESLKNECIVSQKDVAMHLPVLIRDYTDFYSSIEHATNVGTMFRGAENALMPNWKHIPVGYHGRASSIIPSGVDIHRPKGQTKPNDSDVPVYGESKRMDFELEVAFITGKANLLGESIATKDADEYVFGFVLFNDWSARDIQKWEYVPLGPFLGKNFASSISTWIVTLDALEPYRVESPAQDPQVLPYLAYEGNNNFDVNLEVSIQPENQEESVVCRSNYKYMYWNYAQQIAHHTVNGCNLNIGDLYASGTISGKDKGSYGSMLELSWAGKNPVELSNGETRTFLQDNDTVIIRGYSEKDGIRIGFGEVKSKILPAK